MDVNNIAVPLIVIVSGLFSFFTGFLLGSIDNLFLVIGFLPLVLSRLLLGKKFLEYIVPVYAGTLLFQGILHLPVEIYPEPYIGFFTQFAEILFQSSAKSKVLLENLQNAITYKALLGSFIGFGSAYSYREDYVEKVMEKLNL